MLSPFLLNAQCLFKNVFMAALGLCCCMWAFSSFGKWGPPFTVMCRFLIVVDSVDAKHGALVCGLGNCDTFA